MEHIIQGAKHFITDVLFHNVPKIIMALLVLWIGWRLIKVLNTFLDKIYQKKNFDVSLRSFLRSTINITLKILLILTVMNMTGIEVTSFIAMLGAAGLAIGMALQGTLQNFAGGIIILTLRPYKVGDYIEQGEHSGTVLDIHIFNTILKTIDNKIVVVPNTDLATKSITNYTTAGIRRVDVSVGIAYGESVEKAREAMIELAKQHPKTLTDNEISVKLVNLGESSVDLKLRLWVSSEDYWETLFDLNEAVYNKFKELGITIPFNQMDIHISKD